MSIAITEFKAIGRLLDEEDELGAIYAELLGMVRCVQSAWRVANAVTTQIRRYRCSTFSNLAVWLYKFKWTLLIVKVRCSSVFLLVLYLLNLFGSVSALFEGVLIRNPLSVLQVFPNREYWWRMNESNVSEF